MSHRIRANRHHVPKACEHHCIVPTSAERTGRCLECGAHVLTPFTLRSGKASA